MRGIRCRIFCTTSTWTSVRWLSSVRFHISKEMNVNSSVDKCEDAEFIGIVFYLSGDRIISTFAFLQAVATRTFVVYSMDGEAPKDVCTRIQKYSERGFRLLEPHTFDGDFDELTRQSEIPLYRAECQDYLDDDGEPQTAFKQFWRRVPRNIDTFNLQDAFVREVCTQCEDLRL